MKTQNSIKKLGFGKNSIVELQENELTRIEGGSIIKWLKEKIEEGLSPIGQP